MELGRLEIDEPTVKAQWLRALSESRAEAFTAAGVAVRFARPTTLEFLGAPPKPEQHLELVSKAFGAPVHLAAKVKTIWGGRAELDATPSLASVARRSSRRLLLPTGSARIVRSSYGPLEGAAVRDLGPRSLGLVPTRAISDSPTDFDLEVEVELDGVRAHSRAIVINRSEGVGLWLENGDALALVREAYLGRRFPQLRDRSEVEAGKVESLAEESGFRSLRPGIRIPPDWAALKLPTTLGRDAAYVDPAGRLMGIMSATRTGQRAWLVHQLAADKQHPDFSDGMFALHDFMMTYPRASGSQGAHLMCYFDRSKSRNEIYYDSFERLIADPSLVGTMPLQRFERPEPWTDPPPPTQPTRLRIRRAVPDDDFAVCELIRSRLPQLHADALEIFPGMLNQETVHQGFASHGLKRGREVLLLVDRNKVVCSALCEFGTKSLSLFGLFNICHLFRRPGCEVGEGDERRLLEAVRRFYRERGVSRPVITSPSACFDNLREPGTRLAETMAWYVWHPDVLPQYENFYRFRFGSHRAVTPRV